MNPRLAAVGNLQVDNVVAATGEVGVSFAGGNGGYSAVGARLWAKHCLLVAQAPENFPSEWLDELDRGGVDLRGVTLIPGFAPSLSEWFFYRANGSRTDFVFADPRQVVLDGKHLPQGVGNQLQLDPEASSRLEAAVLAEGAGRVEPTPALDPVARSSEIAAFLQDAEAVHVAPASLALHRALMAELRGSGKVVSLDPGHYVKNLQPHELAEIIEGVTIFAPSEREVFEFRGPCDLKQAALDFAAMGPACVVIKLGAEGSLVYQKHKGTFDRVPAYPARTLDPTGCGDSFCAGLLAGYVETGDALEAARYGTIAASFTVEGFGVTYSLRFTREDAEGRLAVLRNQVTPAS